MVRIKQSKIRLLEYQGKGVYAGKGTAGAGPSLNTPLPEFVPPSQAGNEGVLPAVPEVAPEPLQPSLPDEALALPAPTQPLEESVTAAAGSFPPFPSALSPPPSPPASILNALPPSSPPAPSSSEASCQETREAEATPTCPRKGEPSTGDSQYPRGPGAVAAVETPVLAPIPPVAPLFPLPSNDLAPPVVERLPEAVFPLELLADSVFATEEPCHGVPTYAEAVTPEQLAAYDAAAEWEYRNLLVGMREYICATTVQRAMEGSMEWIMSGEEWFMVEAEETAMDFRR